MKRLRFKDLSLNRLTDAILRRIVDLPESVAWNFSTGRYRKQKEILMTMQDKHRGKRCFILANGPSLARMDLSPLVNEITFGLNRIYLLFDEINFLPTYYVCINELVLEQFSGEIGKLPMPKFINWNRRNLFPAQDSSFYHLKMSLGLTDRFMSNMVEPLSSGGTVTYVAIQLAFFMGFSRVILVGLDHSFADKGVPNKVETRTLLRDENHFHPEYFPKGSKWQLPDLARSEIAYKLARDVYEMSGREIVDATANGKCHVFPKVDYSSLF